MVFEAGAAGLHTALFNRERKDHEQINIIECMTWPWRLMEFYPFQRLTFTRKEDDLPELTHWWVCRLLALYLLSRLSGLTLDQPERSIRVRRSTCP